MSGVRGLGLRCLAYAFGGACVRSRDGICGGGHGVGWDRVLAVWRLAGCSRSAVVAW